MAAATRQPGATAPPATSPAPTDVTWIDATQVFVNAGRRVLFSYDYLCDAGCGQVGFAATR